MKAMILSAGKATRLGAEGASIPKPMILYRGKPLLQHNLELCIRYGITDLFINVHHHPEQVTTFFGNGAKFGVSITYSFEAELLGTAGGVKNVEHSLNKEPFFVLYGDNYSEFDLSLLRRKNEQHQAIATIAFHYREDIATSGVAEFEHDQRIKKFVEKPKQGETQSRWVNAGIYYLAPSIFDHISQGKTDFGHDVFPSIIRKGLPIYGVCEKVQVKSFDTPEMYKRSMESQE